jgi:hypothetical protein
MGSALKNMRLFAHLHMNHINVQYMEKSTQFDPNINWITLRSKNKIFRID